MCTPHRLCLALILCLLPLVCAHTAHTQTGGVPAPGNKAPLAPPAQTPAPDSSDTSDTRAGLIKLDVTVTDNSGKSISGLQPGDFTLLDNGQPNRILSFQAFDGISTKPDPAVQVILVIDALQVPSDLISFEKGSLEAFLRRNGGRLAEPVSIYTLLETGLWQVAEASIDGNKLAAQVAHNNEVRLVRSFGGSLRAGVPPSSVSSPPLTALQALGEIATAERRKPGRKLLLWVGPGWGVGSGAYAEGSLPKNHTFYAICWFSALLREARIALYSFSTGETDLRGHQYLDYLHGVESLQRASFRNLDRKVLAVQSGGRVLDKGYDLISQIESCVHEAGAFYTLSFDPSSADHVDEYHELKVQIGKPGLTTRTNTGYYDQPYYSDQPNPAIRQVTVAQLEQTLEAVHGNGDADVARQLSALELTEPLSSAKLASWTTAMHGKKTQQALTALADVSAFLHPSVTEIPADAPPDAAAQQHMLSLAIDYLKNTIPKLPNFFATRTTIRYEETAQFDAANRRVDFEPLHLSENFKETVLYRNGSEVAEPGAAKRSKRKTNDPYLITYGTFGPVLGLVHDAIAAPSALTWSRWEHSPSGPRAVFRYMVPEPVYGVWGCCLPGGNGTTAFEGLAGYHGEIEIDPASGAILRLEVDADLSGFTPLHRSDIMITYGPVEIGGKTFICPLRSVALTRMRSVTMLMEGDEGFRTYGPYDTELNDITYGDYHMFRGESRMMPGFNSGVDQTPPDPGSERLPAAAPPAPQ
jgi:VWFA-related protein